MTLLIDGYNLLHASGVLPRRLGPGTLERARHALLNFLVESLPEDEVKRTTIVFDAQNAPPGLPASGKHGELSVLFSRDYENADAMLEELIAANNAPRQLIVVSSDHRVQRAAKRRKATAVDSDRWYAEVTRARAARNNPRKSPDAKPGPPTLAETDYWLNVFDPQDDEAAEGEE